MSGTAIGPPRVAFAKAAMLHYATTFNIAGSFEANQVSACYRSPVELGWENRIRFDRDFIGRQALEEELARPRRVIRTLVRNADDVIDVYASLFRPSVVVRDFPLARGGARSL
jgi:vanillate/3-O-methylgallate O-demethylase